MTDYYAVLVGILLVILGCILASRNGVISPLASGGAAMLGVVFFYVVMHLLPGGADALLDITLTPKFLIGVSLAAAFLGYVISVFVFRVIAKWMLGPDGPFHWWVDGVPGGLVSLVPSLIGVIIFFLFVRTAGSLQELKYVATLSQSGLAESLAKVPPYPLLTRFRDGIEDIPGFAAAADMFDPFGHRQTRRAVALSLMVRSPEWIRYLEGENDDTLLVASRNSLNWGPETTPGLALGRYDYIGLLLAPELNKAARDSPLSPLLSAFTPRQTYASFLKELAKQAPAPRPDQ